MGTPTKHRNVKKIEPATSIEGLPIFLTVDQVASILRIRSQTVRDLLKAGRLPGVRVGGGSEREGRWRIPRAVIEEMLHVDTN